MLSISFEEWNWCTRGSAPDCCQSMHEVQCILSGRYIGVLPHFGNLILTLSMSALESAFHLWSVLSTCVVEEECSCEACCLFCLVVTGLSGCMYPLHFLMYHVPMTNCWDGYIFKCRTCPFPVLPNHLTYKHVQYCNHLQDPFHINLRS